VEEACKAMVAQGKLYLERGRWERSSSMAELGIPQSVRTAILARLARLTPAAQDTLRRASIVGQEFDFDVLHAASDLDEEALLTALEESESAQFIEGVRSVGRLPRRAGLQFAFVHALVPHTIGAELTRVRRVRLHARVGAALERVCVGQLEELAPRLGRHFAEAGEGAKAADYLLLAGDAAQGVVAFEQAIDNYEQALPILLELGDRHRAAQTYLKLGSLYHSACRFEDARTAYRESFSLYHDPAEHTLPGLSAHEALPLAPHALRLCWGEPDSLDPAMIYDGGDAILAEQLFSGLLECDPEMNLLPEVAWKWEILENGRKYIFHLRDDWKWSDGVAVTAHDFEFAWKRVLDPACRSANAGMLSSIRGAQAFNLEDLSSAEELGVRALDDFRLAVELEEPAGYFLHMLASLPAFPVPRHVVEARGDQWTEPAYFVSNGPFRLASWQPGTGCELKRNARYVGRFRGNLDAVEVTLLSEPAEGVWNPGPYVMQKYVGGLIDYASYSHQEFQKARQRVPGDLVSWPMPITLSVCFNLQGPPFDDARLRRALVHAVDRQLMVDVAYGGEAIPATGGLIPPGVPGHASGIGLVFDPPLARRLLAEAGYPGGSPFEPLTLIHPMNQECTDLARNLRDQWRANLGIQVEGKSLPWPELSERCRFSHPAMAIGGWTPEYPDPDSYMRVYLDGMRMLGWNEEYKRLVREAGRSTDQPARLAMYAQADRLLCEQAALMPLIYGQGKAFVKPWIRRVPKWLNRGGCWKDVIIDPH